MKRFLSLLAVSFILASCNFNFQPTKQRWFLGTRDFRGTTPSMAMKISSAEINGNHIRLFVHVTDTSHHHYQGIAPSAFCKVNVVENNRSYPVNNLRVSEYKKLEREPLAIAFVLDNSGSMGNRTETLYNITHQFIDSKREQDAYSILRYATYTSLDVDLTPDKHLLKSEFGPIPKKSISGSTSTWDAVAEGVASLENSSYNEKILIVFTDGMENSSVTSKEWAFWKAKTAGVKVVAISLGKAGETNMKDLCEQTGGMYVYINNIPEVKQAYTDFQNKLASYYLLEFETPLIGRQTVYAYLCDDISLYGEYTFNNNPMPEEPIRHKQNPPANTSPAVSTPTNTPQNTGTPRTPVITIIGNGGGRAPAASPENLSGTGNGGGRVPTNTSNPNGGTRTPVNTNGSTGRVPASTSTTPTPNGRTFSNTPPPAQP